MKRPKLPRCTPIVLGFALGFVMPSEVFRNPRADEFIVAAAGILILAGLGQWWGRR